MLRSPFPPATPNSIALMLARPRLLAKSADE